MRSLRHRYATAPLPFHFAVLTVWFGAVTWALGRLLEQEPADRWWSHAVGGVLWGAFMTAWIARRRRQDGGTEQQWALGTAIRRGELPADADGERWRPLLERHHRMLTRAAWQAPLLFGVLGLLGAGLAAGGDPRMWWTVAVFVVLAVVGPVSAARRARTVERLLGRLGPQTAVDR